MQKRGVFRAHRGDTKDGVLFTGCGTAIPGDLVEGFGGGGVDGLGPVAGKELGMMTGMVEDRFLQWGLPTFEC